MKDKLPEKLFAIMFFVGLGYIGWYLGFYLPRADSCVLEARELEASTGKLQFAFPSLLGECRVLGYHEARKIWNKK